MEVGFLVDADAEATVEGGQSVPIRPRIQLDGVPKVLPAGEAARFVRALSKWPGPVYADDPLRAYAVDSHGRTSWGTAVPMLRLLLLGGWEPKGVPDPRLLEPAQGPVYARPVAPRWKLWVASDLRKRTDVSLDVLVRKHEGHVNVTFNEEERRGAE
jgi:hypothetical protein